MFTLWTPPLLGCPLIVYSHLGSLSFLSAVVVIPKEGCVWILARQSPYPAQPSSTYLIDTLNAYFIKPAGFPNLSERVCGGCSFMLADKVIPTIIYGVIPCEAVTRLCGHRLRFASWSNILLKPGQSRSVHTDMEGWHGMTLCFALPKRFQ